VEVYLFQTLFVKIDGLKIVKLSKKSRGRRLIRVIVVDNGRRFAYNGETSAGQYGTRRGLKPEYEWREGEPQWIHGTP
jgi:hypothetical protein